MNYTLPTTERYSPAQEFDPYSEFSEVNRLIIIGNGFDLAHGLKTSFKDFIEDYFYSILKNVKDELKHDDPLISITSGVYFGHLNKDFENYDTNMAYKELRQLMTHKSIKIERESDFLKSIYNDIETKNWVDIELVYFDLLKKCSDDKQKIKAINKELDFLKRLLKEYLEKEYHKNPTITQIRKLDLQFGELFKKQDAQLNTIKNNLEIKSICVLNFNYTHTPEIYLRYNGKIEVNHIQIHGSLEGDDINSQGLIFGFGDELDEEYLKFENLRNDELFEHIKSFKYLQFQNYRKLLEFIEGRPFQVHLYGHSLGLSDRTLLNTVFENENCISIKIFYHKYDEGDDFEQKTHAISRHFKSKASLRSKVVNKEFCEPMGQRPIPKK
jgi:hypothetical protein